MANVNLDTRKVYGADKGTKTFYHEVGHTIFQDSKYGNIVRVTQDNSFKFLIFSIAFNSLYPSVLFKILIVFFILLNSLSEMYEEWWCWDYAEKIIRGKKKHVKRGEKKELS